MAAYYNEFDKGAAAWLRELIRRDLIAPGDVDERSIEDVRPDDLRGYTQHHFFAGIGGWSYALRLAGWPDDKPVWTGSCPCQPFSSAGKGAGFDDQRHLWPAFFHLIRECRPASVFGEQVASKTADAWIDLVHADLEGLGYAFGSVPFPSAGIGAPHIRDRNYWVGVGQADAHQQGLEGWRPAAERAAECAAGARGVAGGLADANSRERDGVAIIRGIERDRQDAGRPEGCGGAAARRDLDGLADAEGMRREGRGLRASSGLQTDGASQDGGAERMGNTISCGRQPQSSNLREYGDRVESSGRQQVASVETSGDASDRLAHPDLSTGRQGSAIDGGRDSGSDAFAWPGSGSDGLPDARGASPLHGFWRAADWLLCRDGKWRPVEPGSFPLAHGLPASLGALGPELAELARMAGLSRQSLLEARNFRVRQLRGYGNAINPHQAAEFIRASGLI